MADKKDLLGILEGQEPAEAYSPSDDERKLLGDLRTKFDESNTHRQTWERNWELSRIYLRGQDLVIQNRTTGDVFRLVNTQSSKQLISSNNVLRPTARALRGKLSRSVPTCVVIPPSNDLNDIQGSEAADSLLSYHKRLQRLDRTYIDLNRDVVQFGTAIVKLCWDKMGGARMGKCKQCGGVFKEAGPGEECPNCAQEAMLEMQMHQQQMAMMSQATMEMGEPAPPPMEMEPPKIPKLELIYEGEVKVEKVDLREIWIDPTVTELDQAQWYCHRSALPVVKIRAMFPKKAKYIESQAGIFTDSQVTAIGGAGAFRTSYAKMDNHAFLYEWHEKPTTDWPNGRIIWSTDSIILEEVEDPYFKMLNRLPIYAFFWERNPGEFWGESPIEQSWQSQRELNILLTQLREHRELTNRPKMLTALDSMVSVDEIDTSAGQVIKYNANTQKPDYLKIPELPQYVYEEQERLKGDIRNQFSVSEQEVGLTNSESSGRYAAIMEADAAQQVGPTIRYNNAEWVELHRGILILCQEYYTPDRRWTIVGSDYPRTYQFDQMNLSPGWDVDIQEDDSLSSNHAVRLTQALNLWSANVFLDQQTGQLDKKAFIRMARLKMPGSGPEYKSLDHARAAAIPHRLAAGEQVFPQPWDDADIFAEELHVWLKANGEKEQPGLVQQVVALWQAYTLRTREALMIQQQRAQAAEAAAGGSPQNIGNKSGKSAPMKTQNASESGVLQDANAGIKEADAAGESASRMSRKHEG